MTRLEELNINKQVNKTRLKDRLLEKFPEAQEQSYGKNSVLVFKEDMKNIVHNAVKTLNFSEDALILSKAAMIVRKDILSHKGFTFTGSFSAQCQEDSLPSSLKALVSMILNGSNLKDQSKNDSQAKLTIGQTIVFNTKKRTSHSADKPRHILELEPPLPIYIGMNVHALSRNKTLTQQLFHMGICISYDRVMEIEDWIATSSCERFREDGVVAPVYLRKELFHSWRPGQPRS
ncbi:hypothetical protein Pcinc_012540 [Petrolisthes cinctipes]|uniref:Uncharacterized protein n=1 Tax=Petrolisthes cinctipes TaxID=88211 RepID=A0AAE1G1J9_PETCI|nr:hypothetical protein Pcinc_012540 [Petrolisthes cinctipes]